MLLGPSLVVVGKEVVNIHKKSDFTVLISAMIELRLKICDGNKLGYNSS